MIKFNNLTKEEEELAAIEAAAIVNTYMCKPINLEDKFVTKEEFENLRVEMKDTFRKSADVCTDVADKMREVTALISSLRSLESKLKDAYKTLNNVENLN